VRLFHVLFLALQLHAQGQTGQPPPKPDSALEVHLKAIKLVEASGVRDQVVASIPDLVEQGKAEMRKRCADCSSAFFEEWGRRMAARLKADDFLDAAAGAYEKPLLLGTS